MLLPRPSGELSTEPRSSCPLTGLVVSTLGSRKSVQNWPCSNPDSVPAYACSSARPLFITSAWLDCTTDGSEVKAVFSFFA